MIDTDVWHALIAWWGISAQESTLFLWPSDTSVERILWLIFEFATSVGVGFGPFSGDSAPPAPV